MFSEVRTKLMPVVIFPRLGEFQPLSANGQGPPGRAAGRPPQVTFLLDLRMLPSLVATLQRMMARGVTYVYATPARISESRKV